MADAPKSCSDQNMNVSSSQSRLNAAAGGHRIVNHVSAIAILIVSSLSGCATWEKSHEVAISQFSSGDIQSSREALEKSSKSIRAEEHLLDLDRAMLDLASGDVVQAESRFRTIRRELEFLEQKAMGEQATSMMTDSRAIAFSGRDFERRMILNMALLTSLLGDGTDAFAYSLQATEAGDQRRKDLIAAAGKNPDSDNTPVFDSEEATAEHTDADSSDPVTTVSHGKARLPEIYASSLDQPLALSSYLSAAIQSEQPSRERETDQALRDVQFWNAAFDRHIQTVSAGDIGVRCRPGHGTVHVISLVGKAPKWISESTEPTSNALLIADRIISFTGKHTLPPTIASVKIAKPEPCPSRLPASALTCAIGSAGSQNTNALAPLTFSTAVDLNEVARASYEAHRDHEIAQAVVRRVTKKGTIYVLKEAQNVHRNSLVDLGVNVAGVAWEALEKADTRSWRLLPGRIDIARAELPAGQWNAQLNVNGSARQSVNVPFHIEDGRNTFVVCLVPDHRITGNILIGGADHGSVPADPVLQHMSQQD